MTANPETIIDHTCKKHGERRLLIEHVPTGSPGAMGNAMEYSHCAEDDTKFIPARRVIAVLEKRDGGWIPEE
jgi:hypothetical protein